MIRGESGPAVVSAGGGRVVGFGGKGCVRGGGVPPGEERVAS
jgi:hypothetical protein